MAKIFEGGLSAKGLQVAIVVSRFNDFITSRLLDGACDVFRRSGCDDINIFKVPGALEVPPLTKKLIDLEKYDAIICLGAVIRGATPHFEYVSSESSKGIAKLSIDSSIPIIYGILTCDSIEQAVERAGSKQGNKGADTALTAIEMVNLYNEIDKESNNVGFNAGS